MSDHADLRAVLEQKRGWRQGPCQDELCDALATALDIIDQQTDHYEEYKRGMTARLEAAERRLAAIDALEHLCGSMEDYEWMEAISATKAKEANDE